MAKRSIANLYDAPKSNVQFSEGQKSKGILDDHAVRQNVASKEGTIEHTPTEDNHIVNKKHVDNTFLKLDCSNDPLTNDLDTNHEISISADNKKLTMGAGGSTDYYQEFDGTNTQFYTSGGFQYEGHIGLNVTPINSSYMYIQTDKETMSGINNLAMQFRARGQATADTAYLLAGVIGEAQTFGAYNYTSRIYGVQGAINHVGTGTITKAHAIDAAVNNFAGLAGTITNARGLNINIDAEDGTITNANGVYINDFVVDTGTLTTSYGIYLEEQTQATNNYQIYSVGGDAYFGNGNIETIKNKITNIGGIAIKLTNKTGANSIAGQLVEADTTTNDAVSISPAGNVDTIGVFLDGGIADGAEAWVVISGIADVAMDDNLAATRGYWVGAGVLAGYATNSVSPPAAPTHFEEIGHCIESVAAGGAGTHILARCVLHFN